MSEHSQTPTPSLTRANSSNRRDAQGDFGPNHSSKVLEPVAPPLSDVSLQKFIYFLLILVSIVGAYYSFRVVQYKTEVGGWWNLALGRIPLRIEQQRDTSTSAYPETKPVYSCDTGKERTVEHRMNQLAEALGIPSTDLASAIASAVKDHVPPASLSSIVTRETSRAVRMLTENGNGVSGKASSGGIQVAEASEGGAGIVEGVVSGMGMFVGMDEP